MLSSPAASSGLGRKIAQFYGREGAKVVVSDIRKAPLPGGFEEDNEKTTVDEITSAGGTASFVMADVTKQADVAALVAAAVDMYGRIDIMFNNAGVYRADGVAIHMNGGTGTVHAPRAFGAFQEFANQ